MGHRQPFPSQSYMGYEDVGNHPYHDPHLSLGTTSIGVSHMPYFDVTLRSNNFPSSNFCLEIPNGPNHSGRVNPGNLHDFFPHPSSANSSNLIPPNYIQGGLPCYHGFAVNSHMDYERAQPPYKRKNPAMHMAFDGGNNYGYHSAGSSSSLSVSSVNLQANHTPGPQYVACDPNGVPSSYRGNDSLPAGDGSHRNVRSRQSIALHLGNNGTVAHQPRNLAHHHHPPSNISGLIAAGQWGQTPASLGYNRRMVAPGAGSFGHEINQSLASINCTNSMDIDGGYYLRALQNRISSAPLPIPHPPSSQLVGAGRSSYDQRMHSFRDTSSYQPAAFSAPLAEGRWPGIEAVPPPRYSSPLSIIGRSSDRNGRSRVIYDRLQPFSYGNHAHNGWERAVYDSRNFFDLHHDMRLDIDNMSYEELLALGERIGNVNTGLSGDAVARCLVETIYTWSNQQDSQEEENCAVCLEEYKDGESVGRLTCGHDFHSSCIKTWLSIKNACPICKALALPDGSLFYQETCKIFSQSHQ